MTPLGKDLCRPPSRIEQGTNHVRHRSRYTRPELNETHPGRNFFKTPVKSLFTVMTTAYTTPMLARHFRRRSVRWVLALLTVFAVLYAQGLRVCIHGAGFTDLSNRDAQTSIYLESALAPSNESTCSTHQDVSLSGILKDVSPASLFLLFLAILIILLPPRRLLGTVRPQEPSFDTRCGYGLRPPLRAPPR